MTDDEPAIWTGEEHFDVERGVGTIDDPRLVHFEAPIRDWDAYSLYIHHAPDGVGVCTKYDDGETDFGALVTLNPEEARRLAHLIEDAADYLEAKESHGDGAPDEESLVDRLKEVFGA